RSFLPGQGCPPDGSAPALHRVVHGASRTGQTCAVSGTRLRGEPGAGGTSHQPPKRRPRLRSADPPEPAGADATRRDHLPTTDARNTVCVSFSGTGSGTAFVERGCQPSARKPLSYKDSPTSHGGAAAARRVPARPWYARLR